MTLLENVQLSEKVYLKLYTFCVKEDAQHESIQTFHLLRGKKYHSINITAFMSTCLKSNLSEPYVFDIELQVFETNGRRMRDLNFFRLFDVQVDVPLIMFFYGGIKPAEFNNNMSVTRKPRSIAVRNTSSASHTRPATQCQRRNFIVKPIDVDWLNVVQPKVLNLGYCSGACPFLLEDDHYNFTLHSFLLSRYRLHNPFKIPPDFPNSSYCIPLTYKGVWVLETLDTDKIEAGVVYNLSVESCGCR